MITMAPTSSLLPLLLILHSIHAFSTLTAPAPIDGIKIVGLPGGKIESLPNMYVQSFRRWIVNDNAENNGDEKSTSCASLQVEPLKGAVSSPLDEGWVNPTTVNELWWPRDLPSLQIRPMMNVLYRSGFLSYVSVGLDVRVPHSSDENGKDGAAGVVSSWRNYGLNSQPIARQWTTLDIAMEKLFHVEGFILYSANNDSEVEAEVEQKHETLFASMDVQSVMQKVATFSAELDSSSPLADGFHIASFPMVDHWTDLPSAVSTKMGGDGGKETKDEDETVPLYKIVCMATSEPFANKLLDMDEDLLTMSASSVLEVVVSRTAGGGSSEYLPEPYKALYAN